MARMTKAQKTEKALSNIQLPAFKVEEWDVQRLKGLDPRLSREAVDRNIGRPVFQNEGETLADAVFRVWDIAMHKTILEAAPQAQFENDLLIEIARDTQTGEERIIEGNRSTVAVLELHKDHPKGHEMSREIVDADGKKLVLKFPKHYNGPFRVRVYEDLSEEQFLYAQQRNVQARVNYKAIGVWKRGVELFRSNIKMPEKEVEIQLGASLISLNPRHTPGATWRPTIQAMKRPAACPVFVEEQFLKAKGGVDGHTTPNDKDMRKVEPLFQKDYTDSKALDSDPLTVATSVTLRACKTLDEYVAIMGETEAVTEWREIVSRSGLTRAKGSSAMSGSQLADLAEKVASSPSYKGLVQNIRGMTGWAGEEVLNILIAYSSNADECFRKHDPEGHAKFRALLGEAQAKASKAAEGPSEDESE